MTRTYNDVSARIRETIVEHMPKDAEMTMIESGGARLAVHAKSTGVSIGKKASVIQQVVKETRWRPSILRAPPVPSKIIASTRHILHTESEERSRILRDVGERIFRPTFTKAGYVRLVTLGSFREVGRSAMLIQAGASTVLMDCGINPGAQDPSSAYPRLD